MIKSFNFRLLKSIHNCGLDTTQIESLKEEHGALVLVEVKFNSETQQVIFKEPTFKQLKALTSISKNNEMKAVQTGYANYIVKADKEVEQRDMLKVKAVEALIRSNFQITPEELQISEWTKMYAQAYWLEEWRLKNQAELFKAMFGG